MNETMTLLMAQLKQFKKKLDGADVHALAPAMILESIGAELESIRIHKKESGLSDRRQDHIYRKVKRTLRTVCTADEGPVLTGKGGQLELAAAAVYGEKRCL